MRINTRRLVFVIGLLVVAVATRAGSADAAPTARQESCYQCASSFQFNEDAQGGWHFLAYDCERIGIGSGHLDCFEGMQVWVSCSMYGSVGWCWETDDEFPERIWTASLNGRQDLTSLNGRQAAIVRDVTMRQMRAGDGAAAQASACDGRLLEKRYSEREQADAREATRRITI